MIQIVNTNDTRLRLSQLNVGLFSTLSIALPQVPATATEVQIIITNGTIASAYNATLDTGDDCWKCDVNLGQFSSVGKQKYEVAYKIDGKQMWDGQGWIEILPATVSGITPQPTPPPTRYAAVSITVNGSDPVFADENGNIALTLPNYDGKLPFKPLPEYLHAIAMDDTYPADADAFYQSLVSAEIGGCSAVRIENRVGRNYDWKYDRAAEFVVKVSKVGSRHASVGIASLGSRLTENMVMSGEYQPLYRALAGMTLDGINDAGVVAEINVIPRDSTKDPVESSTRNIHALAVVRYALDNFATALEAAQYIAAHYYIPEGFTDSYHWSIYDINESYIVEDGEYHKVESGRPILTNHRVYSTDLYGSGYSRDAILSDASTITEALSSVKFTNAYAEGFPWADEFAGQIDGQGEIPYTATERLRAWATEHITPLLNEERKPAERGNGCWQTVHSTIYDLENKTLAVCVQEDFTKRFIFAAGGSVTLDDAVTRTSANGVKSSGIWSAIWGALTALPTGFTSLYDWCVAQFAKKVNAQIIPTGAYTFTNGKNGFRAWAWRENGNWKAYAINVPSNLGNIEITDNENEPVHFTGNFVYLSGSGDSYSWNADSGALSFFDEYPNTIVTNADIPIQDFIANLTTTEAKAKIAEAMPAPINPVNATTSGKAADALAVKNALDGKVNRTDVTEPSTDASYLGKVADAFHTGEALATKLNITNLAPAYSDLKTGGYAVDDFCSHGGKIYQCVSATSGVWDSSKWDERDLLSLFSSDNGSLISTIEAKVNAMFDNGETTDYPRTTGEG